MTTVNGITNSTSLHAMWAVVEKPSEPARVVLIQTRCEQEDEVIYYYLGGHSTPKETTLLSPVLVGEVEEQMKSHNISEGYLEELLFAGYSIWDQSNDSEINQNKIKHMIGEWIKIHG